MDAQRSSAIDKTWGGTVHKTALQQIGSLMGKQFSPLDISVASDGCSFRSGPDPETLRHGVVSVCGEVVDEDVIVVKAEMVRAGNTINLSAKAFFKHLAALGEKCSLTEPQTDSGSNHTSLWVELRVCAVPMSMSRENAFVQELSALDEMAKTLQSELPATHTDFDLVELYEQVADHIEPVQPWHGRVWGLDWARETMDFVSGSVSVAICSPYHLMERFGGVMLAQAAHEMGMSVGSLLVPTVPARALVELAKACPGTLIVPALRMSLGSNPYEMGAEVQALLATLSACNTPVLFSGTIEQLQSVFHGGQGGSNDPLYPILRHVPDAPVDILAEFAVHTAGQSVGGLPPKVEEEIVASTLDSLSGQGKAQQMRLMPVVATRSVNAWKAGSIPTAATTISFVSQAAGLTETLAGLSDKSRAGRSPRVQEHHAKILIDPGLFERFAQNILAQDAALHEFVDRMRMEVLARPMCQPFRYCAQGTPGTGKSESAVMLARFLGIPYVNIDAASMPDYHTAAAQLLGSGRGIVGSHQSGRLEQVAKHHAGAVVEISDLDHAVPHVRCVLADLFLQILETGEAQSATGAMFSCANLIFAFTMNLPAGQDEAVRKRIGFSEGLSRADIGREVATALKDMLSGAFLSRVGTPILFDPLTDWAMHEILERSIRATVGLAASRLDIEIGDIVLGEGLGASVMESLESNVTSFGARVLLEHGRGLATTAMLELTAGENLVSGEDLMVESAAKGQITITTRKGS